MNVVSPTQPQNPGVLMAIGGAEDKVKERHILQSFFTLAGGKQAAVVVIPAASGLAAEVGKLYHALFCDLGVGSVEVVDVRSRLEAADAGRAALVGQATAIFLTGGDQLRLVTLLSGTPLAQAIRRQHAAGVLVAGTSAGASALGEHMIAFGRSGEWPSQRMVNLTGGLGLTNRVLIDQHFQQRGRIGRLMVGVAYNPFLIGLGIDEDTAAILQPENTLRVVGRGSVIVVDGAGMTYTNASEARRYDPVAVTDMRLHSLTAGFGYDLQRRQPELPPPPALVTAYPRD